jgi:hypothetical protein
MSQEHIIPPTDNQDRNLNQVTKKNQKMTLKIGSTTLMDSYISSTLIPPESTTLPYPHIYNLQSSNYN